ncbi:hypothetical protein ACHAQH_003177 [Verticillium albo-atrum]
MHSFAPLAAALVVSATIIRAIPAVGTEPGLRLIKTSELEPARWVTDEKKDSLKAADVHFFDITDITDEEVLSILSTSPTELRACNIHSRAIDYPKDISHQARVDCLTPRVNTDGPKVWLKEMTDMWNRHYRSINGTIAAHWMFDLAEDLSQPNPLIEVTKFVHAAFDQPSTIVKIPGETEDLVIVGAHFDSIASGGPGARAPGADDNGSGVVVILEALRILAQARYRPHNTIEFHFYAGEEGGLLGSNAIFADYKARKKSVLGFVNQDMAGYSPSGKISIFMDYVDPAFTAYTRMVAEAYTGETTEDRCGYACSDHGPAYNNGFPAAYACDEVIRTSSPWIHSGRDTYDTIMFDAIHRHSVFTLAFLVEASYLDKADER